MKTPRGLRPHITIFGDTNAGKSALFNAIVGSGASIVSDIAGTTTDPVSKPMELIPFGPVVLTDTAGLSDSSALGRLRISKTEDMLTRTDLAIYCVDTGDFDKKAYDRLISEFITRDIPYISVLTKRDLYAGEECGPDSLENAVCISVYDANSVEILKRLMIEKLSESRDAERGLLHGLILDAGRVLLIAPVDSESPKGRLILPQVQTIRECLDRGHIAVTSTPETLTDALKIERISLVITDSQVFAQVAKAVPASIPLTSFSILTARQKGKLSELVKGAKALSLLQEGSRVLIAEACSHSYNHEDIGRVKIPAAVNKLTGKNIRFDFTASRDFPKHPEEYSLIIHCGGCMMTRREMMSRISAAAEAGVPITNYGVLLALSGNVLDRSVEIFRDELEL